MYSPHWLRCYLSLLECNVVVLDAVWVCALLHHRITWFLLAKQKRPGWELKPRPKGSIVQDCWDCFQACASQHYTCLCTDKAHLAQRERTYWVICTPIKGVDCYGREYWCFKGSDIELHPGYWLQCALSACS